VSRWRFFHVDSSKEVLGREREDQVVQQCESYLTQMRKGSNDAHQVTPRESEILDLLRLGQSNKEIAEYLRTRVSIVKFHATHVLAKLQISSRQDLFTDDFRRILNKLPLT